MSESRETTLNASDVAASPGTKRDSFHWPKYSLIVGTITTSAVNASESVGCQALAGRVELPGVPVEPGRRGRRNAASGSTSPNSSCAVAVEIDRGEAISTVVGQRAPERALGDVEEVAGLLEHGAVGSVRSNGTALSGSSAALEPASRMTSYSASDGMPATMPSTRS